MQKSKLAKNIFFVFVYKTCIGHNFLTCKDVIQ